MRPKIEGWPVPNLNLKFVEKVSGPPEYRPHIIHSFEIDFNSVQGFQYNAAESENHLEMVKEGRELFIKAALEEFEEYLRGLVCPRLQL